MAFNLKLKYKSYIILQKVNIFFSIFLYPFFMCCQIFLRKFLKTSFFYSVLCVASREDMSFFPQKAFEDMHLHQVLITPNIKSQSICLRHD